MKIIHIDDERWDSGLTDYALTLALSQKMAGHDLRFWGKKGTFPLQKAQKVGLETVACQNWAIRVPCLRKQMRLFRPDIVNVHTGSSHSLAAAISATLASPPAIVRTRGDARPVKARPFSGRMWKRTRGFIAANAAILAGFRDVFGGMGIISETIYQGIPDLEPVKSQHRAKPPVIGMVGRLDPVKGHKIALQAAAAVLRIIPDALFCFAGADRNISSSSLAKAAAHLGISRNVRFDGYVPNVGLFMKSCDLGIIPSTGSEAVSRVAIEWMSAGIPVVCSRVGSLPELVKDSVTGLVVPPADPQALASAVLNMLLKPDRMLLMGQTGRLRYENNFTLEKFVRDTDDFYEKALCGIPLKR